MQKYMYQRHVNTSEHKPYPKHPVLPCQIIPRRAITLQQMFKIMIPLSELLFYSVKYHLPALQTIPDTHRFQYRHLLSGS